MSMLESGISRKLTFHARHSLKEAGEIALACGDTSIEPKHLLFALYMEKGSLGSVLLENMGFDKKTLNKFCLKKTPADKRLRPSKTAPIAFSDRLKSVITQAYSVASRFAYPYVGSEHLTYALIESSDPAIRNILESMHLKKKQVRAALASNIPPKDMSNLANIFNLPDIGLSKDKKSKNVSATPFLDQYGIDLTEEVGYDPEPVTRRTSEIDRMIQVLGRRTKNNPILIGEPGVGKTTLVNALAKRISEGTAGDRLAHKKIIALDLALVVAGTNFRGEFEARLKEIIFESAENPDIILFIDEIHTIIGAGNVSGGLDAANILKPALSRGDIQCIGATTFAEYKRHIEKDPAFERRFQPILVAEPTPQETRAILEESKTTYETFHNVSVTPEALDAAIDLSVRFLTDRFLPDKAFDLLDEAASSLHRKRPVDPILRTLHALEREKQECSRHKERLIGEEKFEEAVVWREKEKKLSQKIKAVKVRFSKNRKRSPITLGAGDIAEVVSQMTHIPLEKISLHKRQDTLDLKKQLEKKIIGQDDAIEKLSKTLLRSFSGVGNPDRPLGSFLFLGPSGVGKTLAAKALAETLFEDKHSLIRLDMSEFMERHSIAQIIGAPAGYIGYGEGGKLTEKVRRKPYSVILFDEIEKAHPDVFNILLQILDEGMLTDAEGRKVSFCNTLIILTSNIGTQAFTQTARIGFSNHDSNDKLHERFEATTKDVLSELKRQMRPELLSRLDHIIIFRPLDKENLQTIAKLELNTLASRLAKQGIELRYKRDVVSFITDKSDTGDQGARLVRKNIQDFIENIVAETILSKKDAKAVTLSVAKDSIVAK